MALRKAFGHDTPFNRVSDAARSPLLCNGDFPGVRTIDSLLELRSLGTPRTMLKIVDKYNRAMQVLLSGDAMALRSALPASYPFWMLFLIAIYYRLEPKAMDDFIRGAGHISELMRNPRAVDPSKWRGGPMLEFCRFASNFSETVGLSMQLPQSQALMRLSTILRENTFTPDR